MVDLGSFIIDEWKEWGWGMVREMFFFFVWRRGV